MEFTTYSTILTAVIILAMLIVASPVFATVMESASYQIDSDSINVSGIDAGTSASYIAKDTVGEVGTGPLSGVLYLLKSGYRQTVATVAAVVGGGGSSGSDAAAGSGGGTTFSGESFAISMVSVTKSETEAEVSWQTNQFATSVIFWGETLEYEIGSLSSSVPSSDHKFTITGLSSGKKYYYRIESTNASGQRAGLVGETLRTNVISDLKAPANVTNLGSVAVLNGAEITWHNPSDSDLAGVKVVRSETFYPISVNDGDVIYDGLGESLIDQLQNEKIYFYSVFSYDLSGNYSSGALIAVRRSLDGISTETGFDIFDTLPKSKLVDPRFDQVTLSDFDFIQNGQSISFTDDGVILDGGKPFKIAVAYEVMPEVLKTILMTIVDRNDSSRKFSFMLRVNRGQTAYEATVDSFEEKGDYQIRVAIIDHDNGAIKILDGKLQTSYPLVKSLVKQFASASTTLWPNLSLKEVIGSILAVLILVFLGRFVIRKI